MPYLTGSRLKVQRAREHLEELEREAKAFLDNNPYRYSRQLNPQNLGNVIYNFPPQPAPPLTLAVILGDVVHNLRSALDHVAWQLALLTTDKPYHKTAFPIFTDTSLENVKNFNRLVRDVLPDAIPIIEALQPYHTGQAAEDHPLWILHCIWNADKHRLLTTMPARLHIPTFSGPCGSVHELDDGTIRMEVPKSSEPEKNLEPHIKREILFETPGAAKRVGLDVLRRIYHVVGDEIVPLFARYLPESTDLVDRRVDVVKRDQ